MFKQGKKICFNLIHSDNHELFWSCVGNEMFNKQIQWRNVYYLDVQCISSANVSAISYIFAHIVVDLNAAPKGPISGCVSCAILCIVYFLVKYATVLNISHNTACLCSEIRIHIPIRVNES